MLIATVFSVLEILAPDLTMVLLAAIASYSVANAWSSKKGNDVAGFYSRKFIITVGGITLSAIAAYMGFMTAGLSQVVLAAISSYNLVNAWIEDDMSKI